MVLFTDKLTDAAADAAVSAAFREVGAAVHARGGGPRFALATDADAACERVRGFIGLGRDADGDAAVRLIVLNIPRKMKHVWPGTGAVPSKADIEAFVELFVAGSAPSVGIRE